MLHSQRLRGVLRHVGLGVVFPKANWTTHRYQRANLRRLCRSQSREWSGPIIDGGSGSVAAFFESPFDIPRCSSLIEWHLNESNP